MNYGVESTMTTPETKCESRPVIVLECFSDKECYEDWIDQFESIADINHWNERQKLMWLKIRLTRRALMAYKKFPTKTRGSYKNTVRALQERFEPESRRDLYLAEFQTRCKGKTDSSVVLVPKNHFSLVLVLVLHLETILVSINSNIPSSQ